MRVSISPHGRAYAVHESGHLVVIAVYLAGARAVAERIAGPAGYDDQTPSGLRAARRAARPARSPRPARPTLPPTVYPVPAGLYY